ncbi:MAG: NUDIX domain-containing protein [Clostridiales bacterium]|nr:NUDIX domain-containing protein [Clostridiales bacterium]
MQDILFKTEEFVFSYRIGGVLIRDGKILLQRSKEDGSYAFIGGHVNAMETARETLVREFAEELHAAIRVRDLLAVGEIFFPWDGRPVHQIALYFAVELESDSQIPLDGTFSGYDELNSIRYDLDFCWVPLSELDCIPVYPQELLPHILSGSKEVLHFVSKQL